MFLVEIWKIPWNCNQNLSNKEGGELDHKLKAYARKGIYYYIVFDPLRHLSENVLHVYESGLLNYYRREDYKLPDISLGLPLLQGEFENTNAEWMR